MRPTLEQWLTASKGGPAFRKNWPLLSLGVALLIAASTRRHVPSAAGVLLIMGQAHA